MHPYRGLLNKLVSGPNKDPYLLDRERGETAGVKLIWLENPWWVGPRVGPIHPFPLYSAPYWPPDSPVPETNRGSAPHIL